ncbi:MAG: hypothetical protein KBT20_00935 [Bacteroidales bacterium]|nr:hypothetical protein [Candidatus Liminaster caballi]
MWRVPAGSVNAAGEVADEVIFQLPVYEGASSAPEYRDYDNDTCGINERWYVDDSIEAIDNADLDGTIYDLQGRRVDKIIPGHIYIVNGKKMIL